jgi:hypothetical protein
MQGFLQNVKQIGVFEERPTAKAFVFKNARTALELLLWCVG